MKGIKKGFISSLEKLYRKKIPPHQLITVDFGENLAELSYEINKEIAVIINRRGQVINVTIGDANSVKLGKFKNVREGKARLCGLRCIHTHPSGTPELSKADTTALEQNRFDVMACISVNPASTFSKKQGETVRFADSITTAFLIPEKDENGNNYRTFLS